MQATLFCFGLFPPPASRAYVLNGQHGASAGRAADGAIALVIEPVIGHLLRMDVVPDRHFAPLRQRIEFFNAMYSIEFLVRKLRTIRCLLAPLPGDPGALAGERTSERLDFADIAALVPQFSAAVKGIAAVEIDVIHHRSRLRLVDLHVEPIAIADGRDQRKRVVVKAAGVEDEYVDRQL